MQIITHLDETYTLKQKVAKVVCTGCCKILERNVYSIRVNLKRNPKGFVCLGCKQRAPDMVIHRKEVMAKYAKPEQCSITCTECGSERMLRRKSLKIVQHPYKCARCAQKGVARPRKVPPRITPEVTCSKCLKPFFFKSRQKAMKWTKAGDWVCRSCSQTGQQRKAVLAARKRHLMEKTCEVCGTTYMVVRDSRHLLKKRCHTCASTTPEFLNRLAECRASQPRVSSIQLKLYDILREMGIQFYEEGESTKIGYWVFDCLVEHAGRKLLIECQGDYWHSLPKTQKNDRAKFTYVSNYFPEYEIMYLWESEFSDKFRIVNRIKAKLGMEHKVVEFKFEDVSVKRVTYAEVRNFLNAYHYLGDGRGGTVLCGSIGDSVVAVCIFSKPVRQNMSSKFPFSDFVELSRLCIHPEYQKKNFASWFISRCVRLCGENVVSYADTTAGHAGTVYKASNFIFHHEVPPDYWYHGPNNHIIGKKNLYDRAVKAGMTEKEYADQQGFTKKWGGKKLAFYFSKR